MKNYTQLNAHSFALKRSDITKDFKDKLLLSRLYIVTWEDETFFYIQDPNKVSHPHPLYFRSFTFIGSEPTETLCDACSNRNRFLLSGLPSCSDCVFDMAPTTKNIFSSLKTAQFLKSSHFEEQNAYEFYHSVFKKSTDTSWSGKQLDVTKVRNIVRIHPDGISFPLWRFSKKNTFLNCVHPYIKTKKIPGTTFIKTDMHKFTTSERDLAIFDYNQHPSGKKSVMDEAFAHINGINYSIDIDTTQFPILIPYHFTKEELLYVSIQKVDSVSLAIRSKYETIYEREGWLYERIFQSLDQCIRYMSERPFTETYEKKNNLNYLFDGIFVYRPFTEMEKVRFYKTSDQFGNFEVKVDYYGNKNYSRTLRELLDKTERYTYCPEVYSMALSGYDDSVGIGDDVFISQPDVRHGKLENVIGKVTSISGENLVVSFLNGYFEDRFTKEELTLFKKSKSN